MGWEATIGARLAAHAGLAALVSTRIYAGLVPSTGAYPCVSFFAVGEDLLPAGTASPTLRSTRIQVDCWARDADPGETSGYTAGLAIRDQVLAALDRWNGAGPPLVMQVFTENAGLYVPDPDLLVHHFAVDFTVWWQA